MLVARRIISFLRALRNAAPAQTLALVPLVVVEGLLPIAFIVATGVLVGSVPEAVEVGLDSGAGRRLMAALVATAVLYVVRQLVTPVRSGIARSAGHRLADHTRARVMRMMLTPAGIAHLEDPTLRDDLERKRITTWHYGMLRRGAQEFTNAGLGIVSGSAACVLLARFRWWAPVVLVVAMVLKQRWANRETEVWERVQEEVGPAQRRAAYFHFKALRPDAHKEFRLFGLTDWWVDRWQGGAEEVRVALRRARPSGRDVVLSATVVTAAFFGVFVAIARAASVGEIDVGGLTVYVQAALMTGALGGGGWEWWVLTLSIPFGHLERLPGRILTPASDLRGERTASGMPLERVRFEGVRFAYPLGGPEVLAGLDLSIEAGRSLAIVGENGAGKTTLTKLLVRLYDPTGGRITIDGVELTEIDPASWRRQVAVIFQDFVRFPWNVRDNVRAGWLGASDEAVERAAVLAGADRIPAHLERGWDTVPMRSYAGGADISGGEWQRLALARALLAVEGGARMLVLDEPTAQLDVRAEAELFDRFLELTEGLTTILISHRFSSVRHVDRIVVLDEGRITEDGTHDELTRAGGRYAGMFELQARPFREERFRG